MADVDPHAFDGTTGGGVVGDLGDRRADRQFVHDQRLEPGKHLAGTSALTRPEADYRKGRGLGRHHRFRTNGGVGAAMIEHDATEVGWQTEQTFPIRSRCAAPFPAPGDPAAAVRGTASRIRLGQGSARAADRPGRSTQRVSGTRSARGRWPDRIVAGGTRRRGRAAGCTRSLPRASRRCDSWMGVIKQERDGLDRVLRRYVATGTVDAVLAEVEGGWHAVTATPWSPVSPTSRIEHGHGSVLSAACPNRTATSSTTSRTVDYQRRRRSSRFRVVADRSAVLINARSSVGPITFGAIGVTGIIEAAVAGRRVCSDPAADEHIWRSTSNNCGPATACTTPSCCAASTPAAIRPSASICKRALRWVRAAATNSSAK